MTTPPSPRPVEHSSKNDQGIFRVARADVPALKAATLELNHAFLPISLSGAKNVPGFLKAISRDLAFPEWFGGNLDALYDCLTDLSWIPASGYVITLDNIDTLQANPTSFAVLNAVLGSVAEEWQARKVPFKIFYLQED